MARRIEEQLEKMNQTLRDGFAEVNERLAGIDEKLDGIDERLDGLERRKSLPKGDARAAKLTLARI
jgi:tetrahydromethanopterin S-methyltransferase subunit G